MYVEVVYLSNYFLVEINTPVDAIMKPIISIFINSSSKKIHAINAVTTGIKKNNDTVLLAELFFIKYIKIEKAPKETRNTW